MAVTAQRNPAPASPQHVVAPGSFPLAGHAIKIIRNPLEFFQEVRGQGRVVQIRLGPRRVFVVTCPELVQQILITNQHLYDKGGPFYNALRPVIGNGLATCGLADHKRQRPLMQPAFHPGRLPSYGQVMADCATEVCAAWTAGQTIAVDQEMHRLSALISTRTLISTPQSRAQAQTLSQEIPPLLHGIYQRIVVPAQVFHKIPTAASRRHAQAERRIEAAIEQVIIQYRSADTDHGDLLSLIMAARDDDATHGLTDSEIHDEIMTIMLGSIETVATLLSWTFHLLTRYPDAEQRLWAELDDVLGGAPPRYEDVSRLPYTARVLTETLRMYPPVWLLSRVTTTEVTLGGAAIPPGSDVLILPYLLHSDPRVFPDASRFIPDRWLPENITAQQRAAFHPMGAGRRKCIGDDFAMTEAAIALAAIASRWQLRHPPGTKITPTPRVTLKPSSMLMTVDHR
jgi:cytochrome P450